MVEINDAEQSTISWQEIFEDLHIVYHFRNCGNFLETLLQDHSRNT